MASPDPAVIERQSYLNLLGMSVDDTTYSLADLREMTAGGANAARAANAGVFARAISDLNNKTGQWVSVKDRAYGAKGDGVTDDTIAIQAAINSGIPVYFPNGDYLITAPLVINTNYRRLDFAVNAWIKPQHSGVAISLVNASLCILDNPKIKLGYNTGQIGIGLSAMSTRNTINLPVWWAFTSIQANTEGIVVDDNCYWTQIVLPRCRKDSGSLAGQFKNGIRISNISNASEVWGGDFAHCDSGVYIEDTNAVLVCGGAFEGVTDGIVLAGTVSGLSGTRIIGTRHESCTTAVKITSTIAALNMPIIVDNPAIMSSVTTQIDNPNNIPLSWKVGSRVSLLGTGLNADKTNLTLTAANNQTSSDLLLTLNGRNGIGRIWAIDPNGNCFIKSDNAALPTHPEAGVATLGFIRFYSTTLRLAAWSSNSTSGAVTLATGDGAGGIQDRVTATGTSFAPTQNGAMQLGLPTQRWTHGYIDRLVQPISTKTANYNMVVGDHFIIGNGAAVTISLPDPTVVVAGVLYVVKNINAGSLTVNSQGATKTIDGAASQALAQWAKMQVVSDGTQWFTV